MLGEQRRAVAALAARTDLARARADAAGVRLERAKSRFLGKPANLLLPFTAGLLCGALALYRQPQRGDEKRRREGVSWASLLTSATTVWRATLPLREALRTAHGAPPEPVRASPPPVQPSAAPSVTASEPPSSATQRTPPA